MIKRKIKNNDFETGWSRDERYILNKIRHHYLEKLEKEKQKIMDCMPLSELSKERNKELK